jgi:methylated-DNA-[protein]-cysteine S-methyltransferase
MNRIPIPTALGTCTLLWEGERVTGFRLPGGGGEPVAEGGPAPEWAAALATRVALHMSGDLQDFAEVPFDWERVGEFQRDVYRVALGVKPGVTWSYGQVAKALGMPPGGARAVGTALGQNPWPLLVPCHRFIAADGKMTGFSAPGGIRTKLKLLALEGAQLFAE